LKKENRILIIFFIVITVVLAVYAYQTERYLVLALWVVGVGVKMLLGALKKNE